MTVAIITPYYQEPLEYLAQCHDSVRGQTYPDCVHLMIADGYPRPEINHWNVQHIQLPQAHRNYGDTPRAIGCLSAIAQQVEAIVFLDADNWYYPHHVETLLNLHRETQAPICTSQRMFYRLDGTPMGLCPYTGQESPFIDTNCLFVGREAFKVLHMWGEMPPIMHAVGDRYMAALFQHRQFQRAHTPEVTVAYRTAFRGDYHLFGEVPPVGVKTKEDPNIPKAVAWWKQQQGKRLAMVRLRQPSRIPHPSELASLEQASPDRVPPGKAQRTEPPVEAQVK
ncbi:MAG: glycosyltransferase [Candidatus Melainabacteria bacterium]|nr:glycosyltransferase [Candidatus Melainabacteria bacterium]